MHRGHSKHEFALFLSKTSELAHANSVDDIIIIDNTELCHRICNILRLSIHELYYIFDQKYNILCKLLSASKKNITAKIISIQSNQTIKPTITFLLPLLKRTAFEESLYSLTELGASNIIPIITRKIHPRENTTKTSKRFERIIQAAAEQSKNFSFPVLHQSMQLKDVFSNLCSGPRIFFDLNGSNLLPVITKINNTKTSNIVLMVGPEADLLPKEKKLLHVNNFRFCKLTQTVLRAQQAVAISLGIFRSILKE